ncbi:MAG: CD1247 N-terminal domain-containing protein [Syntrophaceticus sp.]
MDDLRERIAYLQGLSEGLKLDEGKDEGRILKQVVDIIADLVDEVEDLQVAVEDLEDYLDAIDDELFEDDDDLIDFDEEDDDEDFCCCDDDIDYVEVECPQCHDIICFESDIIDDEDTIEVTCPNCSKVVFVNDGSMPLPEGWEKRDDKPRDD